ncbi:MAG: 2,3,4,5-tetrahydropyridine-2,6-dicarboxylate N-succinyltransferase [Candidatus Sumerlaeia bacterium]
MSLDHLKPLIDAVFHRAEPGILPQEWRAVAEILEALDAGRIRVAEKTGGEWVVNETAKKAILLHFKYAGNRTFEAGDFRFFDKVPVKTDFESLQVRCVPQAIVRYGAFVAPGVVLMPSYINIGAYVDSGTMIDTWATIGSCAQVGRCCHISGGVGIGGVLEPPQAAPVIIEDNVFIGARSEVAEGVIVEEGAVLAMGCYIGRSTRIFNAMTGEISCGRIPARAVCVPGALPAADGSHSTYAIIIKKFRDDKTEARVALNEVLRMQNLG